MLLYCYPMQFFIPFPPISARPQYLHFITEHLNLITVPLVLPTLTSLSLRHFKRSALSSMSKISIAIFSSSNWYSFGHSLTLGFRVLLWLHQLAELGRSSLSMCFTHQKIHYVFISYSSLLYALVVHFISAIFYSLSPNLHFSINFEISFSLSHFCVTNFIIFWKFTQNYSSGFNSASPVTNRTKAVSHENSWVVGSFFKKKNFLMLNP